MGDHIKQGRGKFLLFLWELPFGLGVALGLKNKEAKMGFQHGKRRERINIVFPFLS